MVNKVCVCVSVCVSVFVNGDLPLCPNEQLTVTVLPGLVGSNTMSPYTSRPHDISRNELYKLRLPYLY